jgi:signal peptidase I
MRKDFADAVPVPIQPEKFLMRSEVNVTTIETRERAKREIAEEVLRSFGELRFVARGLSMLPAIFPGDVLTVRRESIGDACKGDVVLAAREGRLFAHRVVACVHRHGSSTLITRGDALETTDLPVTENEWLGRVSGVTRRGERVEFGIDDGIRKRMLCGAVRRWDSAAKWLLRFRLLSGLVAEGLRKTFSSVAICFEERAQ